MFHPDLTFSLFFKLFLFIYFYIPADDSFTTEELSVLFIAKCLGWRKCCSNSIACCQQLSKPFFETCWTLKNGHFKQLHIQTAQGHRLAKGTSSQTCQFYEDGGFTRQTARRILQCVPRPPPDILPSFQACSPCSVKMVTVPLFSITLSHKHNHGHRLLTCGHYSCW